MKLYVHDKLCPACGMLCKKCEVTHAIHIQKLEKDVFAIECEWCRVSSIVEHYPAHKNDFYIYADCPDCGYNERLKVKLANNSYEKKTFEFWAKCDNCGGSNPFLGKDMDLTEI